MASPASAPRRKSQVFVQVPPSPYSTKAIKPDRTGPPDNTPLKAVAMNAGSPSPSSSSGRSVQLKRKSPDEARIVPAQNGDAQPPRPKKPKTDKPAVATKKVVDLVQAEDSAGDASGTTETQARCHQCARNIGLSVLAHCTAKRPNGVRCLLKYCKACLKNRYEENLDTIKTSSLDKCSPEEQAIHVAGVNYIFRCPRCRDVCNCRYCRKSKGLPPTGNLHLAAKTALKASPGDDGVPSQAAEDSARKSRTGADKPVPRTKAKVTAKTASKGPHGSKPKPHILIPPSPYKIGPPGKKPRVAKPRPQAPPKPMPKPLWTALATPLTFTDAIERMNIREFMLRFAHLADIARSHLEELEDLATNDPYIMMADDDEEFESSDLVGWISEPALKAILVGMISLFAKDAEERDEDASTFTQASQQLRASGANLNKMWTALAALREESDLDFPDPLPPPAGALQRSTRSVIKESISVVSTFQFVPIIAALVESALDTQLVQEDFERAATQEKELARAARELSMSENARYRDSKADGGAKQGKAKAKSIPLAARRAALAEHEAALAKIEYAHRVAVAECIPRFGPLGRDTEGRVYYAITPGVIEREAALGLLEGGKGEVRFGKRRDVAEVENRKRMKHWSWFVAIWGRKPKGADVAKLDDDEEQEDGDEEAERWWAFWQPEEIGKLAEWLAMKYGINLDSKRIARGSQDSTVLDVDDEDGKKSPGEGNKKTARGRPSNASSAASSSRLRLNTTDDDSDESSLSGFEDDEDDDVDDDGDIQMRLDSRGQPVPTRYDLRMLARGLKDYGELLEWRIKRATKEREGKDDGEKGKGEETEKVDKGKGRADEPIPPATFYGK